MRKVSVKALLGLGGQKEQYVKYGREIAAYNLASLKNLSALGVLIGASLSVLSLPFVGVLHLFSSYLLLTLFFLLTMVGSRTLMAKNPRLVLPGYYAMMLLIYGLSIYMGTVLGQDTNAVTFLLVLLLLPLFVTDYPWRLIVINLLAAAIFIAADLRVKPRGIIRSLDISNTVVVCLLSCVFILLTVRRQLMSFEKLRAEKEELSQKNRLINFIPVGIAVFDVHGSEVKQVYTNDSFYRLFEDTQEARARRNHGDFLNDIHPNDRAKLGKLIKAVIDGQDTATMTCRSMKGDGTYLWVRFSSAVEQRSEDFLRVYSTYTSMEEEMKSREATQAKTAFLSRMSHDMRTPMTGILGLAALSEGEKDVAVLHDNLRRIKESGDYLLSLINDTLDFQQIESGKLTLDVQVVEAQPILDSVLELLRPAIEKKKMNFQVVNENAELDWYVRLDPVRYKQVLINLLSNAIKFTPEYGTVTFAFGCLSREGMISHDYIRISDTGIGMSRDFVENRLFKPFSQESNAVSTQYTGSGLGLSIVQSLVELMGGRIEVESELGVGTSFTVYLDFERVARAEAEKLLGRTEHQQSGHERLLAGKRILLAEDHPLNAEITKRMLSKVGCLTTWAKNGQECLTLFKDSALNAYDMILMDVRMPVMDGQEAACAIRRLERGDAGTIPIIAVTANAYDNDIQNCLDAGMNAHLAKPLNMGQLYRTLAAFFAPDVGKQPQDNG